MANLRDYQRGYVAGRARTKNDARRDFWQAVLLKSMESTMSGAWVRGGKKMSHPGLIMEVSAELADRALEEAEKRGFA